MKKLMLLSLFALSFNMVPKESEARFVSGSTCRWVVIDESENFMQVYSCGMDQNYVYGITDPAAMTPAFSIKRLRVENHSSTERTIRTAECLVVSSRFYVHTVATEQERVCSGSGSSQQNQTQVR